MQRKHARFTDEEKAFLREHYPKKGPKWCAKRLGRPHGSLTSWASAKGVRVLPEVNSALRSKAARRAMKHKASNDLWWDLFCAFVARMEAAMSVKYRTKNITVEASRAGPLGQYLVYIPGKLGFAMEPSAFHAVFEAIDPEKSPGAPEPAEQTGGRRDIAIEESF